MSIRGLVDDSTGEAVAYELTELNVVDYGAVGDNSTDSTAAIQAALDDAYANAAAESGPNVVFIPVGRYRASGLLMKPGITLRGSSVTGTVIHPVAGSIKPIITCTPEGGEETITIATQGFIKDLTINGLANGCTEITGTTTLESPTVTSVSSVAGLFAGMLIEGVGIPPGATVDTVGVDTLTLSANATMANGTRNSITLREAYARAATAATSTTLTVADVSDLEVGMKCSGTYIDDDTRVEAVGVGEVTLNRPTTDSGETTVTFYVEQDGIYIPDISSSPYYDPEDEYAAPELHSVTVTNMSGSGLVVQRTRPRLRASFFFSKSNRGHGIYMNFAQDTFFIKGGYGDNWRNQVWLEKCYTPRFVGCEFWDSYISDYYNEIFIDRCKECEISSGDVNATIRIDGNSAHTNHGILLSHLNFKFKDFNLLADGTREAYIHINDAEVNIADCYFAPAYGDSFEKPEYIVYANADGIAVMSGARLYAQVSEDYCPYSVDISNRMGNMGGNYIGHTSNRTQFLSKVASDGMLGNGDGVMIGDGTWNGDPLLLGDYYLWVDNSDRVRIHSEAPTKVSDGTIVGPLLPPEIEPSEYFSAYFAAAAVAETDADMPAIIGAEPAFGWESTPAAGLLAEDVSYLQTSRVIQDLGEGAEITVPAVSGDYQAAITADQATITLTAPTSGRVQQTLSISSRTLSAHGAGVDVEDAHLDFTAPADTYPRALEIYLGGEDAEATLELSLSDSSATDVTIPLSFTGQEERVITVAYAAEAATQTLDVAYTVTSATGTVYLMGAALSKAPDAVGDGYLEAAISTASRYDLTRKGPQDWVHWGRESASGIDRKAGVTAQISALSVTGDTLSQITALAPCVYSDAEPALSQEAVLAGATLHWAGGEAVDLIPAGGTAELSLVVTSDGIARVCAGLYSPVGAEADAPPIVTLIVVAGASSLTSGESSTYTATVYDQYGAEMGVSAVWSASDGVITQTGVYTAGPEGRSIITASVGSVSGTKSVNVVPVGETGLLSVALTTPTASQIVDLTTEGVADWVHWGLALATDVTRKAGVTAQIGDLEQLPGSWTQTRWYGTGTDLRVAWSDGTPDEAEAGVYAYVDTPWANRAVGQGWQLTADADTSERVLLLALRAHQVLGRLTATLSDGSATPASIQIGDLSTTTYRLVALTYRAASADQTITIEWATEGATGNIAIMAAALDAEVELSPIVLTTVDVTPASATIVEGAQQVFTATPRDQYGRVMAGSVSDWTLSGGGTIASTGDLEGTVTAAVDGAGGPYTVTAEATIGAVTETGTASLTIEDAAAEPDYPEIAFAQSVVDAAIAQPFWSGYVKPRPLGGPLQRVILPLIAKLHPTEATRNAAAARAKATLEWMLTDVAAANWRQMIDRWVFDEFQHTMTPLLCFFTLCRHTPAIWDSLSTDMQGRVNAFVSVWAWGVNMFVNPDHNNGINGVCFSGSVKSNSNRNQNTSRSVLPILIAYYGGLEEYNAHLATYSSVLLDATAGPNGYNFGLLNNIRSAAAVASWTSGATFTGMSGDAAGQSNTYNNSGAKRALTAYRGRAVPADPTSAAAANWTTPGSVIANPTPAQIFIRNEMDGNYALTAIDANCSLGNPSVCLTDPYGHIRPGYVSPYLGQNVMAQEYHLTTRSSQHYVMTCLADATVPVLATLMALGWWKSPDATLDAALAHLRKGIAVVRYRDGQWKHAASCAYESPQGPYWMGDGTAAYGWEIVDRMINPNVVWPGENV